VRASSSWCRTLAASLGALVLGTSDARGEAPAAPAPPIAPESAAAPAPLSADLLRYATSPTDLANAQASANTVVGLGKFQKAQAELQHQRQIGNPSAIRSAAGDLLAQGKELLVELKRPSADVAWVPAMRSAVASHDKAQKALAELAAAVEGLSGRGPTPSPEQVDALLTRVAERAIAFQSQVQDFSGRMAAASGDVRRLASPSKALVVSGGVSLGSYQAGFLYYYNLYLKHLEEQIGRRRATELGRFRVATGASAGSINALLTLLDGCRDPEYDPEKSPFYTTWIGVGFDQLFKPDKVSYDSFLAPDALDGAVNALAQLLASGDPAGKGWRGSSAHPCDAYLGVAATRIRPRYVVTSETNDDDARGPRVPLQRQTEKFLIRIGSQRGKNPVFASHRLSSEPSAFLQELYPTLGMWHPPETPENQPIAIPDLVSLLRASAAFPFAFPPVEVPLTVWRRQNGRYLPAPEKPRFSDGGILDNTPFVLAQKLVDSLPDAKKDANFFVFLKSDVMLWHKDPTVVASTNDATIPKSIFAEYGPFLVDFINGASDNELVRSLEEDPQREIPGRGAPVAGEQMAHFFAFVEEDFRRFDFYQGMVDAFHHVKNHPLFTDSKAETREMPIRSAMFECFLDYRQLLTAQVPQSAPPALPATCQSPGFDANIGALLKASAALRSWDWRGRPRAEGPEEMEVFANALETYGFRYKQFAGGKKLDADGLKASFRDKLQIGGRRLFWEQEGLPSSLGASVLGKSMTNYYWYRAPSFLSLGIVNGLEVSVGKVFLRAKTLSLKVVPTLRLNSPGTLQRSFSDTDPEIVRTIGTDASIDLRGEWAVNPGYQLELGFGYLFRERWRAAAWAVPAEAISYRHGPMVVASLVLFQHLYVSGWLVRYTGSCETNATCDVVAEGFRDFAQPIEPKRWDRRLSFGWRLTY
jgi:predicted acylesterase/phospholipase RssA